MEPTIALYTLIASVVFFRLVWTTMSSVQRMLCAIGKNRSARRCSWRRRGTETPSRSPPPLPSRVDNVRWPKMRHFVLLAEYGE